MDFSLSFLKLNNEHTYSYIIFVKYDLSLYTLFSEEENVLFEQMLSDNSYIENLSWWKNVCTFIGIVSCGQMKG